MALGNLQGKIYVWNLDVDDPNDIKQTILSHPKSKKTKPVMTVIFGYGKLNNFLNESFFNMNQVFQSNHNSNSSKVFLYYFKYIFLQFIFFYNKKTFEFLMFLL